MKHPTKFWIFYFVVKNVGIGWLINNKEVAVNLIYKQHNLPFIFH